MEELKVSWIFHDAVDPIKLNIPDYFKIVPNPMDLGTVKANLNAGNLQNAENICRDVRLIFENCVLYNGEQSHVSNMCKSVAQEFERLC